MVLRVAFLLCALAPVYAQTTPSRANAQPKPSLKPDEWDDGVTLGADRRVPDATSGLKWQAFGSRPRVEASTPGKFDLNGIWQLNMTANDGQPIRLRQRIAQSEDDITITIEGNGFQWDGRTYYKGTYVSKSSITGTAFALSGSGSASVNLVVEDPDHLREANGAVLFRVSDVDGREAFCDYQNTSKTQPEYAYQRGLALRRGKDSETAACWFHAAAVQGHIHAQTLYGMMLHDGDGVGQDYQYASRLLGDSAEKGDYYAQIALAQIYRRGDGIYPDPQMAAYWTQKAAQHKEHHAQLSGKELAATVGAAVVAVGILALAAELLADQSDDSNAARKADDAARKKDQFSRDQHALSPPPFPVK